jgi:hypothetical protein
MSWRAYEIKRAALERKWRPKIFKALQSQLSSFTDDYLKGNADLDKHFNYAALIGVMRAMYEDSGVRFAGDVQREMRGLKKAYNMVRRTKAFGFGDSFAKLIARFLSTFGLNMAQRISETTRKRVNDILISSTLEGLSAVDTVRKITKEVTEINRKRAFTITRTEVGRSANLGKLMGAMEMGIMMNKIWVTAKDERVRREPRDNADHLVLNMTATPLDKLFENGLRFPGDPDGPPHETINCRCTMVFESVRDANGMLVTMNYNLINIQ